MSLNRDGCVIVSRFLSEVGVPSPAAASGKVAVDDELLAVNGVPVVGRRFDDVISQVKAASGAVSLRFSRGYYVENFQLASKKSGTGDSEKVVVNAPAPPLSNLYSVRIPECVALLSKRPIFAEMRFVERHTLTLCTNSFFSMETKLYQGRSGGLGLW